MLTEQVCVYVLFVLAHLPQLCCCFTAHRIELEEIVRRWDHNSTEVVLGEKLASGLSLCEDPLSWLNAFNSPWLAPPAFLPGLTLTAQAITIGCMQ